MGPRIRMGAEPEDENSVLRTALMLVARGGIEPPTFRFSGGRDVRCETFVLVKLDELEPIPTVQSTQSEPHGGC